MLSKATMRPGSDKLISFLSSLDCDTQYLRECSTTLECAFAHVERSDLCLASGADVSLAGRMNSCNISVRRRRRMPGLLG
jgi:hypothetical protein